MTTQKSIPHIGNIWDFSVVKDKSFGNFKDQNSLYTIYFKVCAVFVRGLSIFIDQTLMEKLSKETF